ncbi:MAG: 3-isopropylmalate dehydrogenase [Bacillota bacterium]
MTYKIVVLPGDGIGVEVTAAAVGVLKAVAKKLDFQVELDQQLIGGSAYDKTGSPLPQSTIDACRVSNGVLLGAVGGYKWDNLSGSLRPEAGLLGIRKALNLFANIRPARIFTALKEASPLKNSIIKDGLDIVIVRELTGGIYFGERGGDENSAYDTEMYTVSEIERIVRVGFETAMGRNKKLCCVDKANVLESSRLWRKVANKVHEEYSEVELSYMYVDNCAMQLVKNPMQFDVIVTNNIFGDILSDEAAMISGSIGMLSSASLNEGKLGMYEGIHGSAPDIAGKNIANPLATILSVALMFKHSLGEDEGAVLIENAVAKALDEARTADIKTENLPVIGTIEMGALVEKFIMEA